MKKLITSLSFLLSITALFAQPVLYSDSLHTGLSFNLYSLSSVNTANLAPSGASVTWDLSSATATLAGTADLLDMASTPYASQYPAANFALKFTSGATTSYSLFNLTSSVLEEVANNVGTGTPVSFTNYRTALVFPFTFNLSNSDIYQKSTQAAKNITNTYDSYGTLIANSTTNNSVVRNLIVDDGTTSANWWNTSPLHPLFQASSGGYTLWKLTSVTIGISEMESNQLFDVYPNPATDELSIVNKELISKIEILNIAGQLQFSSTKSTIDISMLSPGVYFIKAYSKKGVVNQKFVKK